MGVTYTRYRIRGIDAYCDFKDCEWWFSEDFTLGKGEKALSQKAMADRARADGWYIGKEGALCPSHNKPETIALLNPFDT